MKPLACNADMHEPSSEHIPTILSGTPGELLVSHSKLSIAFHIIYMYHRTLTTYMHTHTLQLPLGLLSG